MNINWYPGHMTRAKRQLEDKLKLIDVVIEVLDARLPLGSRNTDFDELFSGKKRFCILNKCDLADDRITAGWMQYFRENNIPAFKYSAQKGNPSQLFEALESFSADYNSKYAKKGIHKIVRGMIAGIPNVGKSAILNRLTGSAKVKEGNRPGVTRSLQWVKISDYFEIMDTPGLLVPKISDEATAANIALIGCIKEEILDTEELAYYLIKTLSRINSDALISRYNLEEIKDDAYAVLGDICRKRGFLVRGGEYDYERGARIVLDEFKNGKIGKISLETAE